MKTQKFTDMIPGYVLELKLYKKYDEIPYPSHPVYRYNRLDLIRMTNYVPQPQHKFITPESQHKTSADFVNSYNLRKNV